jgi:hypothetical protein
MYANGKLRPAGTILGIGGGGTGENDGGSELNCYI